MNAGLIIGIVYAIFAVITMIVYDVHNYKRKKKENAETTFWKSILENDSTRVGVVWPITLPFLCKEVFLDKYDTPTLESKIESIPEQKVVAAEPRWISVKKQFPEVGQRVLGFTGSCSMIAQYEGGNNWMTDYHSHSCTVENAFTHWMPLPAPPKE